MTDEEQENEILRLKAELTETTKRANDNQAMIRDLQEILKNSKHDGEELLDKHVRNAIADLIDKSTEYRERLSKVTKERDEAKADNARLVAALEDIAGHVCCTPCDNIAEHALASSTSDKELLSAVRQAIKVMSRWNWHHTDCPCANGNGCTCGASAMDGALSALKKALGE